SAERRSVRPVVERHDHLLLYPVQYGGLERSPNIVYLGAAPNQQLLPALTYALRILGKKRLCLVGSDYVFPRTANAILRAALWREPGVRVVGERYLLLGSTEVAEVVRALVASKPDLILNTINGDSNVAFFRALRDAGVTPKEVPAISFSVGENEL